MQQVCPIVSLAIPKIGDSYGGGYFAGKFNEDGNDYYLIVSPKSTGEANLKWKLTQTSTTGTASTYNGLANSNSMNDANHPASQFCRSLTIGGYNDWYMPALYELEQMYYYFKPTGDANSIFYGANSYARPTRGNYTGPIPAQTTVASFVSGGANAFYSTNSYWTSTEASATAGQTIAFAIGTQSFSPKNNTTRYVRAIRKVAV